MLFNISACGMFSLCHHSARQWTSLWAYPQHAPNSKRVISKVSRRRTKSEQPIQLSGLFIKTG